MTELLTWILAGIAGAVLGLFFFGGLWWTISRGMASPRPALWFFASLLLRMSVTLAGFYVVSAGHWQRMLACLLGFVLARLFVTWLTRPGAHGLARPAREVGHAPQS